MNGKPWTKRELAVLRREYPHRRTADIAATLGRPLGSVYQRSNSEGLRKTDAFLASTASGRLTKLTTTGVAHRFKKGQTSWNKGTHWTAGGRSAETRFKPGQLSGRAAQLLKPIGALRMNADGYLERKVTTEGRGGQRWKSVHRLVWEAANGPVPPGHVVVFKPGRRTAKLDEIELDGLELVTRPELMRRNTLHRYPKEIARLIQLRGALNRQINKRERHAEQD